MQCRSVLTRVDALRTGELPEDEAVRLEEHFETCPSCRDSLDDVGALAGALKTMTLVPERSCCGDVCGAVRDGFGVVAVGDRAVRVAFSERGIRMIEPADREIESFRARYGHRYGRELEERAVPEAIRRAVEDALSGRETTVPEVDLEGATPFERAVLTVLPAIPRGEVRSYSWVAERIGRPRAIRAVGNAVARNPVPFVLPCHRVVPESGGVGKYAFGTPMKRALLAAEGAPVEEIEELARQGVRLVGSATTRVYCVPTCRGARQIRPENLVPFHDAEEAARRGFRPCRICKPVARTA